MKIKSTIMVCCVKHWTNDEGDKQTLKATVLDLENPQFTERLRGSEPFIMKVDPKLLNQFGRGSVPGYFDVELEVRSKVNTTTYDGNSKSETGNEAVITSATPKANIDGEKK